MTTSTQDRAAISTEKYVRNKVVVSETTVTVLLVHVGRGTAFVRVLVCYIFDRDWILKRGREKVPYVTLAEQASNGQAIGRAIFLWQYSLGVSVDLNKVSEEKENVGHGIEKPSTKDRSWNDDEVD
ncbi:hypothetical protein V1477_018752 [Vespula maculifrons]|uniref:Uncharacterized protein n=1 Tax=Vespula maculifrons TaxID=7453 RepID=A0ABD2AW95_VESMC